MRSSAARRGGVSEQGRRIYHSPKREAADGPCVASMTSLNLLERMNELSDGVNRSFNATRAGRRGPISEILASRLTSITPSPAATARFAGSSRKDGRENE